MNSALLKWCRLSFTISYLVYSATATCDSPDPSSSIFHPAISYDVKVISDNSSISSFVTAFVKDVYDSDTLYDLFDLSQSPAIDYQQHAYGDFKKVSKSVNADDPDTIADFATRPMVQNFNVFTRDVMVRVYANVAANYAYSIGALNSNNAVRLAKKYAQAFTKTAKKNVVKGKPESKFSGVGEGIIAFLSQLEPLTVDKVWQVAVSYESQWLLAAVEAGGSNDIYDKCIREINDEQ
ncbi:uncharacterized protein TNIN_487411 [Trichonephila inaurata madagascariensis]|uniref:Uncharacterized protein n=1 Tax=Trichonephila inaurata madagascariensis TaxID=2747483 RepID=A0A8X6XT11_9ARAC|nr:uncharacterized protein TNIN_487411 [Trichonephila inaurata madagascariensis]